MKINLLQGDITKLDTDAIVNAANSSLLGGGGVDGAIHRAGGPQILEECKVIVNRQGKCKVGEAVCTSGGNLQAKYVIHTVGPIYNQSDEDKLCTKLASCYQNSLRIAEALNIKTIAFPNISTGVYRFPKELAAKVAIEAVRKHEANVVEEVTFVSFDEESYTIYESILNSNDNG